MDKSPPGSFEDLSKLSLKEIGCPLTDIPKKESQTKGEPAGKTFEAFALNGHEKSHDIPPTEMNILVLGQTGVGKSTFINALATYITYGSLEEAVFNNLVVLIPTEFHQTDNDMQQLTVRTGESVNECFVKGKSATKSPRAYALEHKGCLYRIIDTPGIGDVDGIAVDKQNMQNIMQFAAQYDKIHAICVLLLPNVPRLSEEFKFCFNELFVQFHKSAANNIIFCYTNTSGYMFKPQETLIQLELLLKKIDEQHHVQISARDKNRAYSFDNMAYRYCCIKNQYRNFEFSEAEHNLYIQSYAISRQESDRMLDFIRTLTPHDSKESMNVFYVRHMVECCTNPLTAIGNAIQKTITQIDEYSEQVRGCGDNVDELKKMLMKTVSIIRWKMWIEEDDYCITCSTMREYTGADRLAIIEADPSMADEDPIKLYTPLKFLEEGEDCENCGSDTRRVAGKKKFQTFTEEKKEEDTTVASRIRNKEELKDELSWKIHSNEVLKKEIESEQKQVYEACAKGAFFLQVNALTPINDATEGYLMKLIDSGKTFGTTKKVREYEKMLANYLKEKNIFNEHISRLQKGVQPIRPDQMLQLLVCLKEMKHYGKDVEAAMNLALKPVRIHRRGDELETRFNPLKMIKKSLRRLFE